MTTTLVVNPAYLTPANLPRICLFTGQAGRAGETVEFRPRTITTPILPIVGPWILLHVLLSFFIRLSHERGLILLIGVVVLSVVNRQAHIYLPMSRIARRARWLVSLVVGAAMVLMPILVLYLDHLLLAAPIQSPPKALPADLLCSAGAGASFAVLTVWTLLSRRRSTQVRLQWDSQVCITFPARAQATYEAFRTHYNAWLESGSHPAPAPVPAPNPDQPAG